MPCGGATGDSGHEPRSPQLVDGELIDAPAHASEFVLYPSVTYAYGLYVPADRLLNDAPEPHFVPPEDNAT